VDGGTTLRVLVVDDHRAFAEMLGFALSTTEGMACVGVCASAAEAAEAASRLRPDAIVLDIEMPGEDGLTATRHLVETLPEVAVVIVSAHRRPGWVTRAAHAGAAAFVPKDCPLHELVDVLRRARPGRIVVAASAWTDEGEAREAAVATSVTPRELMVLDGLGRGTPIKRIARDLTVTVPTCRGYLRTLMLKLGVGTQLEAVLRGQQLGLLSEPRVAR
jgi:DNA-binding NarL/FixJ family response regulator